MLAHEFQEHRHDEAVSNAPCVGLDLDERSQVEHANSQFAIAHLDGVFEKCLVTAPIVQAAQDVEWSLVGRELDLTRAQ